jgi:hypothetical protein
MAKRRKRLPADAWLAAEHRQHLRDELPPGVSLDDIGQLCQAVSPREAGFGCHDGLHSLDLATRQLALGEFPNSYPEILAWLADIGGVCDCTINTMALDRVVELSSDTW